jgi:hypothetical protein
MSHYGSRSELSPIDRTAPRALSPVQAVPPASAGGTDREAPGAHSAAPQIDRASIDEDVASVAEYAKVHVEIADILADLRSVTDATSVEAAAGAIQALMPMPIILVPLPPASKAAVEHAAVIARRMVERAAYAHVAQGSPGRAMVDQVLASAT